MKAFTTVLALAALYAPSAFAVDYYAQCKSELSKVSSQMSAYLGSASSECADELNKPGSQRNNQVIGQSCPGASQRLLPLKQRAIAVCGQCRRLGNEQINAACTDNGLSSFIDAVAAL